MMSLLIPLLLLLLAAAAPEAAAQSCTPFGDPPATLIESAPPKCPGGTRLGPWPDPDGTPRWACLWAPRAPSSRPRPLLVYLHPSLSTADGARTHTNLLSFIDRADLSGDPTLRGFVLLAPQGRNTTHHYPPPDAKGTGWDHWYRQFSPTGDVMVNGTTYRENVDAATIDHFIADEVATGGVDTRRIFLTGWSNGTSFAYEYALNRPGIAAIATYSGADPYQRMNDPCVQVPVAGEPANDGQVRVYSPLVPTYQVLNACEGAGTCPNVLRLEGRLRAFGAVAEDTKISARQKAVEQCVASCGTDPDGSTRLLGVTVGLRNHIRWPDAWTDDLLRFLAQHPLPTP
jgi:hypothetical protein